jgi:hypothetical protein
MSHRTAAVRSERPYVVAVSWRSVSMLGSVTGTSPAEGSWSRTGLGSRACRFGIDAARTSGICRHAPMARVTALMPVKPVSIGAPRDSRRDRSRPCRRHCRLRRNAPPKGCLMSHGQAQGMSWLTSTAQSVGSGTLASTGRLLTLLATSDPNRAPHGHFESEVRRQVREPRMGGVSRLLSRLRSK